MTEGGSWLMGGQQPSLLDIHCFPIFERIKALKGTDYDSIYQKLNAEIHMPTVMKHVADLKMHEMIGPHTLKSIT